MELDIKKRIVKFFLKILNVLIFFILVFTSLGASSGARVRGAALACSASKDFCKDSLTLNDEIGQRIFPSVISCAWPPGR